MATPRRTFVVHVHEDGGAVLVDETTREYVWLRDLSELASQIEARAAPDKPGKGDTQCSDSVSS